MVVMKSLERRALGTHGIGSGEFGYGWPVVRLIVCALAVVPALPFGVTESAESSIRSP